jgi:hypothetical protein
MLKAPLEALLTPNSVRHVGVKYQKIRASIPGVRVKKGMKVSAAADTANANAAAQEGHELHANTT